jgi:2-polyprenyl-6-methoxyphenol hydroxylase-like FAD-dependent oxidoreductase
MSSNNVFDVAVVGAGPVGLALALALQREAHVPVRVALIAPPAQAGRLRTVALSPGSRALLERLGVWGAVDHDAQPIREMTIYDGAPGDSVRLPQLRFEGERGAALADMVYADDLTAALVAAAAKAGVETIAGTRFVRGWRRRRTARAPNCAASPASRQPAGRPINRASSPRSNMSMTTKASPSSISCPPGRSLGCR